MSNEIALRCAAVFGSLFLVLRSPVPRFPLQSRLAGDPSSGCNHVWLESPHFGHCPPNPVDDESDFRHRTRTGLMVWS